MWDVVVKLCENGDVWFVVVILGLMAFAVHQGYLRVKTDKILIDKDSSERVRLLMKKQSEYAKNACVGFEKRIPRFDGYNDTLGELIVEKVYDEIVNWIMINHIEDNEDYIETKQEIVWNIVSENSVNDHVKTKQFKKQCDEYIESIVKRLVQMRERNE